MPPHPLTLRRGSLELRHIPAVIAFWSIAIATIDPRLENLPLTLVALAVGGGLALRSGAARAVGFGVAIGWILPNVDSLAFSWTTIRTAYLALGVLTTISLAFVRPREPLSARNGLAFGALGLAVTCSPELLVEPLGRGLGLSLLAAVALGLARVRPREAASLLLTAGLLGAFMDGELLPNTPQPLSFGLAAVAWWMSEHTLRAVEGAPPSDVRFRRASMIVAAVALLAGGVAHLAFEAMPYDAWSTASLAGWGLGLVASVLGLAVGAAWAPALALGVSVGSILLGFDLAVLGSAAAAILLLSPWLATGSPEGRRNAAIVLTGAALAAGLAYATFRNRLFDPGNAVLAGLAVIVHLIALVGLVRSRTWGIAALVPALLLYVASTQAFAGPSVFDRGWMGCMSPSPIEIDGAIAGLGLAFALYAIPLAKALMRIGIPVRERG
ncbi:MAG: hypothetical protein AB7S26_08625 [Sandaracinaceae bacterium]